MSPKSAKRFSDEFMRGGPLMISTRLSGTFLPWE